MSWSTVSDGMRNCAHIGEDISRVLPSGGMKTLRWLAIILAVLVAVTAVPCAALAQAPIGVLGITAEIAPIEKRLQDSHEVIVRGYVFHTGKLDGRDVVVGHSGAGKVNAAIVTTLLITSFNPTTVLFSGTAGAVDPALRAGDVVIGATVAQHDVGLQTVSGIARHGMRNTVTGEQDPLLVPAPAALLTAARQSASGLTLPPVKTSDGSRVPKIVEGVIVTGDVFMSDAGRREELRSALGATAIEMEGAAVVQTCRQFSVSCLVVRSVTDQADGQALANYAQFIAPASENAAVLVMAIIGRLEAAR
jgi:adenosylhomocysteine nucleosidase